MKLFFPRSLALAATLAFCGLARAQVVTTHPYQGITYITDTETVAGYPVNMHIVEVDLTATGISFAVTPSSGTANGIPATSTQTTLKFLNQEGAQVAINGNFFTNVGTTFEHYHQRRRVRGFAGRRVFGLPAAAHYALRHTEPRLRHRPVRPGPEHRCQRQCPHRELGQRPAGQQTCLAAGNAVQRR